MFLKSAAITGLSLLLFVTCLPTIAADVTFEDVTEAAGLAELGGDMAAWADYDNDGDPDVIADHLFRNNGDGTFTKADEAGISGSGCWGDFDNDGDLDFYDRTGGGTLSRNLGNGMFESVAIPANPGNRARSAAWGDVDGDGFIDLFVPNHEDWLNDKNHWRAYPDYLYRNNGDDTFSIVWASPHKKQYCGRGVNFADFDYDGDQDAYISNYRLMPNVFWINDGNGNFTDEAEARGVVGDADGPDIPAVPGSPPFKCHGHTIGSCWGDVNNDGYFDLVVVNFAHGAGYQDRCKVLLNSGPPNYTFAPGPSGAQAGIYYQESYAKGTLGDYDNDGDLDLFISTVYGHNHCELYENDGTGSFKPVGEGTGVQLRNTYQAAWTDYDNDGNLDLTTGEHLFRNSGSGNSWVKVKVVGDAGTNRAGIGTRVQVTAGDKAQIRQVSGGNSGNQNPLVLHYGLGEFDGPVTVTAFFPSGRQGNWETAPGTTLVIKESEANDRWL